MRIRTISHRTTLPYVRVDGGATSEHLIVTFTKLHPGGTRPTTNLLPSLQSLDAHRLCIGSDEHTFVGPHGSMAGAKTAGKLIRLETQRLGLPRENVIAVGSSMGAVCALFLGFPGRVGWIIAGGVPVFMGSQLEAFAAIDGPSNAARSAAADFIALADKGDGQAVRALDRLIVQTARKATEATRVDLFVSKTDRTFEPTAWLAEQMAGEPHIDCRLTLGEYERHGHIRQAFIPFVLETLLPVCGEAAELRFPTG